MNQSSKDMGKHPTSSGPFCSSLPPLNTNMGSSIINTFKLGTPPFSETTAESTPLSEREFSNYFNGIPRHSSSSPGFPSVAMAIPFSEPKEIAVGNHSGSMNSIPRPPKYRMTYVFCPPANRKHTYYSELYYIHFYTAGLLLRKTPHDWLESRPASNKPMSNGRPPTCSCHSWHSSGFHPRHGSSTTNIVSYSCSCVFGTHQAFRTESHTIAPSLIRYETVSLPFAKMLAKRRPWIRETLEMSRTCNIVGLQSLVRQVAVLEAISWVIIWPNLQLRKGGGGRWTGLSCKHVAVIGGRRHRGDLVELKASRTCSTWRNGSAISASVLKKDAPPTRLGPINFSFNSFFGRLSFIRKPRTLTAAALTIHEQSWKHIQ